MGIDPDEPMGDPNWLSKQTPVVLEEVNTAKNLVE